MKKFSYLIILLQGNPMTLLLSSIAAVTNYLEYNTPEIMIVFLFAPHFCTIKIDQKECFHSLYQNNRILSNYKYVQPIKVSHKNSHCELSFEYYLRLWWGFARLSYQNAANWGRLFLRKFPILIYLWYSSILNLNYYLLKLNYN